MFKGEWRTLPGADFGLLGKKAYFNMNVNHSEGSLATIARKGYACGQLHKKLLLIVTKKNLGK